MRETRVAYRSSDEAVVEHEARVTRALSGRLVSRLLRSADSTEVSVPQLFKRWIAISAG